MFPRWYLLDEQTLKYQQVLVEADAQRRDENISLMHRDMRLREERKREAYDAHDLLARAQQAEAMMEEQRLNEEIAMKMSLASTRNKDTLVPSFRGAYSEPKCSASPIKASQSGNCERSHFCTTSLFSQENKCRIFILTPKVSSQYLANSSSTTNTKHHNP